MVRAAAGVSMETIAILKFAEAAIAQLGERQTEDLKVRPPWGPERQSGLTSRPAPGSLAVRMLSLSYLPWQKKFITSRDAPT